MRQDRGGFSFIELVVSVAIFSMLIAIAFAQFRNSRRVMDALPAQISFQMDVRKASDRLTEELLDCTEIVKPTEGGSLPFLVVRDLENHSRILTPILSSKNSRIPGQSGMSSHPKAGRGGQISGGARRCRLRKIREGWSQVVGDRSDQA